MAPNLAQLTEKIADLVDYPLKSALVAMRAGRESIPPVLPTAGRGRNAAKATSKDAASLLLVMIVCPWPSKAAQYITDFGNLIHSDEEALTLGDFGPGTGDVDEVYAASRTLNLGGTFRDSIARVLDAFGDPSFARAVVESHPRDLRGGVQIPNVTVTIWDTIMRGAIRIDAVEHYFSHSSIAKIDKEMDIDEVQRRYAEEGEVSGKYRRRVSSMKSVGNTVIRPIAKLLSGRDFREMMEDEAKKLGLIITARPSFQEEDEGVSNGRSNP